MLELIEGNEEYLNKEFWDIWTFDKVSNLKRNEYPEDEWWRNLSFIDKNYSRYNVSIFGRIYNDKGENCLLSDKDHLNKYGYARVSLYHNNVATKHFIHVLVLKSFYRSPRAYEETRHLNSNRIDNRLINLTWSGHDENMEDRVYERGEAHPASRLTNEQVLEIRRLREENKLLYEELAKMYGVTERCIGHIINRDYWRHL